MNLFYIGIISYIVIFGSFTIVCIDWMYPHIKKNLIFKLDIFLVKTINFIKKVVIFVKKTMIFPFQFVWFTIDESFIGKIGRRILELRKIKKDEWLFRLTVVYKYYVKFLYDLFIVIPKNLIIGSFSFYKDCYIVLSRNSTIVRRCRYCNKILSNNDGSLNLKKCNCKKSIIERRIDNLIWKKMSEDFKNEMENQEKSKN